MGKQVAARLQRGRSSVGRAPALQAGGQEFESLRLHSLESTGDSGRYLAKCTLKSSHRKIDDKIQDIKHPRITSIKDTSSIERCGPLIATLCYQ